MEGKVIAITRSKEDSEEFMRLINNAKARAISLPTIELVSKGEGMVEEFLSRSAVKLFTAGGAAAFAVHDLIALAVLLCV